MGICVFMCMRLSPPICASLCPSVCLSLALIPCVCCFGSMCKSLFLSVCVAACGCVCLSGSGSGSVCLCLSGCVCCPGPCLSVSGRIMVIAQQLFHTPAWSPSRSNDSAGSVGASKWTSNLPLSSSQYILCCY